MIYLKKLIINNFQIHKYLELNFTQGVNVIYGATDAGKSCIRRALSFLVFNEPRGGVVRKTGTKKTSVKGILSDGVQIERIKSATVNAYILYINGEERRFDAIGKDIPEEVLKVLKTTIIDVDNDKLNLNIANQIALPFLLDKPATFRSKLFNKLTGSDIVDKSLQSLNRDILHINKEEKIEKKSLEEKKKQLEELIKEKEKTEVIYEKVSKIFINLKEKQEKLDKLKNYLEQLDNVRNEIKRVTDNLKKIKLIDNQTLTNLNDKINKLNGLSQLSNKIQTNTLELEDTSKKLRQLKLPTININTLKNKIERLNRLKEFKNKLDTIQILREKIVLDIAKTKTMLETENIKYKELLKKIKFCPFYKKECPLNKEISYEKI